MLTYVNIWPIIRDHFSPFRFGRDRRVSFRHLSAFLFLPAVIGTVLSFWCPRIPEKYVINVITVFSIVGAVMMALLPVVQSIVGLADTSRKFSEGERPLFRQQVIRLQVLRELYAEIAFSVLLMIVGLLPLVLLLVDSLPAWLHIAFSAFTFGASAAVAITFLHIIAGVYLVLDVQAHEVDKKLQNNAPPDAKRNAGEAA